MAALTFSISSEETELQKVFNISDADATRVFAMLVGNSAPITDGDSERPRTLEEAMADRINIFVNGLLVETVDYEKAEAVKKAALDIAPIETTAG